MTRLLRVLIGAAVVALGSTYVFAAESPRVLLSAEELTGILPGTVCISGAGAKFTFTDDGHYAYDGLWTSQGHYSIGEGRIFVIFDTGLARYFALSKKDDVLYMEKTALACSPIGKQQNVRR